MTYSVPISFPGLSLHDIFCSDLFTRSVSVCVTCSVPISFPGLSLSAWHVVFRFLSQVCLCLHDMFCSDSFPRSPVWERQSRRILRTVLSQKFRYTRRIYTIFCQTKHM
jgi:hypothetical protein